MDALSPILRLLTVRSAVSSRLEASGMWGLSFPPVRHVKFGVLEKGRAWVSTAESDPVALSAGDCFVLTAPAGYSIRSSLAAEVDDGASLFARARERRVRLGAGDVVALSGGRFILDDASGPLLTDVLPPLLVVRSTGESARRLRSTLSAFEEESVDPRPGGLIIAEHLGHVVLVEALRVAMEAETASLGGWLGALGDDRIGATLALLHEDPARRWRVDELAAAVQMSRSAFAARFRRLVGRPPLEHLLEVRMHVAGRALRSSVEPISAIGASLGYTSDAAFSHAFRRVMGASPREWRRADHDVDYDDPTDASMSGSRLSSRHALRL